MNARLLFKASAIAEALTGLVLLSAPLFVIELLLGDGLRKKVPVLAYCSFSQPALNSPNSD